MPYRMTVTRTEVNPTYEQDVKEFRERSRYGVDTYGRPEPQPERDVTALTVALTDEQWQAVQRAVLEVFR